MGIGTGIFLLAVGAVLRYAVTVQTSGINLHVVGDILMIVGIIGIIVSLFFWSTWGGFGSRGRDRYVDRRTVVDRDPYVDRRTVVEDRSIY
jgi:hypothetical protein